MVFPGDRQAVRRQTVAHALSGLADRLTLFFEDEMTLTSQASRKGIVLMSARRTLSEDGGTLEIEQTVSVPGQGDVVNTGVYRRAQ